MCDGLLRSQPSSPACSHTLQLGVESGTPPCFCWVERCVVARVVSESACVLCGSGAFKERSGGSYAVRGGLSSGGGAYLHEGDVVHKFVVVLVCVLEEVGGEAGGAAVLFEVVFEVFGVE